MEQEFRKSLFYSTLLHVGLLLLLLLIYQSFLVVRTPLMMDLTLIGQMSQGNATGAQASNPGENPSQILQGEKSGEITTPQKQTANLPINSKSNSDVRPKTPLKIQRHTDTTQAINNLENLNQEAPIGMENQNLPDTIKTTTGLGHVGVAGNPEGNPNIEGELVARKIKHQVNPDYPDWAKKQGIEAVVRFKAVVLPNGLLKEDELQLDQTSGYRKLDRDVYEALIQWEFEPLAAEAPQVDQSGIITFSFSLKNQ